MAMTSHYLDFTIIPGPEINTPHVMSALYEKLHLALVRDRIDRIGVSFPRYSVVPKMIGNVLRIHGTEDMLHAFMETDWLKGVRDHIRMTSIAKAPHDALYRVIKRKQFKTSAERMRRRRMRRKDETAQQAEQAIPDSVERIPDLPYVRILSRSTGQKFCLYVAMDAAQTNAVSGQFNAYGLSAHATVPWF